MWRRWSNDSQELPYLIPRCEHDKYFYNATLFIVILSKPRTNS
jgi:hypothetical protein